MKTSSFVSRAIAVLAMLALGLSVLSVSSCKRKGTEIPVTGVTVSKPTLSLSEGETATISYAVEPSDASVKDVTFSSSDTSVATVDESGRVTAVSPGTATITVTTKDGGFKATVTVTVTAKDTPPEPPTPGDSEVTGITLDKTSITLKVGGTETITATVLPEDAKDKSLYWKIDKTSVAIVDDDGKVSAMGVGSATITVTSKSNPKVSAKCDVTVISKDSWDYIPNKTMSINGKEPATLKSVGLFYGSFLNGYDIVFLENDVKTFGTMSTKPDCNFLVIDLAKSLLGARSLDKTLNVPEEYNFYCICNEFAYMGDNSGIFGSGNMKLEINESANTLSFAIDGKSYNGDSIKCRYEGPYIKSEEYIADWIY